MILSKELVAPTLLLLGGGIDDIQGREGNDILYGGGGADSLSGGAGDDIIIFDAEDTLVDGGVDRDIGIVSGGAGVTVDLAASGLEVVVGGAGIDTFALNGQSDTLQMAAGGDGADIFNIDRIYDASSSSWPAVSSSGPIVVWGGEGADIFNIDDGSQVGILTVNVEGLTVGNFADFNLDMLNLGSDFDWDTIGMVVLNPDSQDRFFSSNAALGVGGQRSIPVTTYSYSGPFDEGTFVELGSFSVDSLSVYDATFLGGGITSIQTTTQTYSFVGSADYNEYTDEYGAIHHYFIDPDESHEYTADNTNFQYEYTIYTYVGESYD